MGKQDGLGFKFEFCEYLQVHWLMSFGCRAFGLIEGFQVLGFGCRF